MLFDEWGQSLQKSRQRLNVCLETKSLERREGFLGARLLCRFLKCLWRFCKVLGALPPHYLGAVRIWWLCLGPAHSRRTGGGNGQGPCRGMATMFGLWPWGTGQHRLVIVPPPRSPLWQRGKSLGRLRDQLWQEGKGCSLPPQNRHNISQCPYRDPWMGKTSAPPHNVGRGGGAGLKIWILETWVSSCWLTVNLGKSIPLSVFQL